MKKHNIWRSIERMPRPAYLFLKALLAVCCAMLALSLLLSLSGSREHQNLALLFLETPAALLLIGGVGLCLMLDRR